MVGVAGPESGKSGDMIRIHRNFSSSEILGNQGT
jgi:hypothetical protein